jgi:hypothetical protein
MNVKKVACGGGGRQWVRSDVLVCLRRSLRATGVIGKGEHCPRGGRKKGPSDRADDAADAGANDGAFLFLSGDNQRARINALTLSTRNLHL